MYYQESSKKQNNRIFYKPYEKNLTNSKKSVRICANLGGGIMQKEQEGMAIWADRKPVAQFVNQDYRDKMVSMGNKYFQKMHRELLKDYKEQLINNLKKFQNPENITKEELSANISFMREVESALGELEHYYEGSKVRTVKNDIDSVREILCIQELCDLEQVMEESSKVSSIASKSKQAEELIAYEKVQKSINQLQNHLIEKGILVPEIENSSKQEKVTQNEVNEYKKILEQSLKMLENLKEVTVLDLLTMIQNYFEIEDKKDALDSFYQNAEDMNVRMDILYILSALEDCERVLPLASYFDKMSLETKIGSYLETVSSKEREEIEGVISKIQSEMGAKESDFDEETPVDFDSVLENVNRGLDLIQNESIDDVVASLENEGIIPVTETEEVKEDSKEEVKVSWIEKLQIRREANRKIREHSKNLRRARSEYLKQVRNLQGQLNHNLKSGLTLMFIREYRDNYYQDKLKTIEKRIERKYGSIIARQLKKDSKINMGKKKILHIMKQLREGFDELLAVEVEKSDGTITSLLEVQNISEMQFQLMMETMPVLVDAVEENMRIVRNGGRARKIEPNMIDFNDTDLEDELLPIEEITGESEEEIKAIQEEQEEVQEEILDEEDVEYYSYEKPSRALMRNSNYHYNTCKILLGLEKRNLHGEELEQVCHRLSKELKAKRNLTNDEGRFWYTYKCSVEEVNNNIRKLRYASNIEVSDIIENIHKECRHFINYFESYQEKNHKTLKEKFEDFYTSTLEDIRDILSLEEDDEVSEFRNEQPDYDTDLSFISLDAGDEAPLLERVEAQEVAYTPRELKELDVIPVVRNLSIQDDIVEQGNYQMDEAASKKTPIVVLGIKNANTYTPLVDLGAIEAQIRFLAQQENPGDEEIYQKAIS